MDFRPQTIPPPLTASDELLKETEHLLQFGTWLWNPDQGSMELSDGMYELMGYSRMAGEFSLRQFLQHLSTADSEIFHKELDKAIENNAPFRLTHGLSTRGGTPLIVATRGKVSRNNNGQIQVLGITQDITDQSMQHEETLQHRRLMDQYEIFLQFGTWEYSAATKEMLWSVGMYSLFGYNAVQDRNMKITEDTYLQHIHPDDYSKGVVLRESTVSEKDEYSWQYRITTKNGETKWLETYGRMLRNSEGALTNTFGITRDITPLKQYEHSLELKIKELNRSNEELEEFAYVASHDMQEPLRKLTTFSERLTSKFGDILQDEGKLYINRMAAATNNMRLLIDNLLDFSRISRTADAFENTDLNNILRKVLSDLEVSVDEQQAQITSDKLPSIEAQGPQMKQLFTNILSNALKFRKPSVQPVIRIGCKAIAPGESDNPVLKADTRHYKITITDNGIGFEQEYAERIFQIFQRLHGKAEYPGSGIGLAICKKIVEYHNGIIYANGQLNEGAVITIILPEKQ
ncbi:MAG: PAS domain-containing protein [Chitinophagaceae bacterium]